MADNDKKPKSDWFTRKYGAYRTDIPDWYSSKIGFSDKKEMPDWHAEKNRKKTQSSDWLSEKHGIPMKETQKLDWYMDKHGFRTDFPGWKSAMDPGNLDRIPKMYAKRFGKKKKAEDDSEDQTTRKEPV